MAVYLILYFSLYAFLGWCTETVFAAIKSKRFINRGFLHGPFCPMYGFASVIIILLSKHVGTGYVNLFVICFFGASIIEYFTGYMLEKIFNAKWWDYSGMPFNLQGRICILYSIIWGLVGIFIIKILQPLGNKLVTKQLSTDAAYILSYMLVAYFILDLIITLIKLFELKSLLLELEDISSEVKNRLSDLKVMAMEKAAIVDYIPKELRERYEDIIEKIAARHSRIFMAFPKLGSERLNKAYIDIRNKIKSKVG